MRSDDLNIRDNTNEVREYLNPKVGIALGILVLLNCFLSPIIFSAIGVDYSDFIYLNVIGSYILVVFSVIFFNPIAMGVFQDHFTLWAIALSCFLPILFPGKEALIYRYALIVPGFILVVYIILNRKNIKSPGFTSILKALGWSVGAVLVLALIYAFFDQTYTRTYPSNLLAIVLGVTINQLAFVSVIEEALFRGLIFSFLVMNGYKENKAFFIQAILFWSVHYLDMYTKPMVFFTILPLSILFLTLIIKKYKMLHFSMMMHTFINVFVTLLVNLINRYLF
jgi:membrane protease YdiL (CAAX protease family)